MVESFKRKLVLYESPSGSSPFEDWLNNLKDRRAQAIIRSRLDRLERGNAGHFRSLGNGLHELKIDFGPGYRVYFGERNRRWLVLLCGGDKSNQRQDIEIAYRYWEDKQRGWR